MIRALRRVAAAALLAPAAACAQANTAPRPVAFARADTARLHRTLDSLAAAHHGVVGYAVRNLDTGEQLSLRGDETFPTASLIKVPILVTVFDLAQKDDLDLHAKLTLIGLDKVPGDGILQFMDPNMELSMLDASKLMIILSDNTATNLVLSRIEIRRVWNKMEALGLPHTKVHSKVYLRLASVAMDSSVKYGLGVTTPNEMATLFTLLAQGKAVSPKADSAMLDILSNNADGTGMQRGIDGLVVPHKTGAVDKARTECAIYPLQSRVVACVFTKENADERYSVDSEAQVTLGRMGLAIASAWPRMPEKSGP